MIRKMCPVCDLPISMSCYCKRCRRFVRHPYEQNVDYYLNERHPSDESSCEYHMPHIKELSETLRSESGYGSVVQPQHESNVQSESEPVSVLTIPPVPASTQSMQPIWSRLSRRKDQKGLTAILLLVLVFAGVIMFTGFLASRKSTLESFSSEAVIEVLEEADEGYRELDEEAVLAAGERCSGELHFTTKADPLLELFESELLNAGYIVLTEDQYSYNYESKGFDGRIDSFYHTYGVYEIEANAEIEDEYDVQMLELDYDTATNEIHQYMSYLKDREKSIEFLKIFLTYVENDYGIPEFGNDFTQLETKIKAYLDNGEIYYETKGMFAITCYEAEEAVYVTVSHDWQGDF